MKATHTAIYVSGNTNKDKIVQELYNGSLLLPNCNLQNLNGAVYSTLTINELIKEELIHEHFDVATENKVSLVTSSGGQQKKALLNYLLAKNPGYIIVDDVFDNLDAASQQAIVATLQQVAHRIIIIQVLNRKKDILPFITNLFTLKDKQLITGLNENENTDANYFTGTIPAPLHPYALQKNPLVQFTDVCVSYNNVPVVKNICWQINNGEFWQLAGPNGSGKSTLLSMIFGDNAKAYGQNLVLFGIRKGSGESVWDIKEKIGYFNSNITQQFDRMDSIEQMIISGFNDSIGLYLKPTDLQIKLAAQWLQLLHLHHVKHQPFRNFSMAQQRLILVARAMVKHPPLLILDEPTAGLDDESAILFTSLVNKIATESTTAILYVSHRVENGLSPEFIFELIPGADGSTGISSKAKNN
ncbi:ABC transporter ATP-binding protein [Ferruginibacter sp.]|nr:ATP-binding cassette domain-containing protein [Ferruginibacter sp.]